MLRTAIFRPWFLLLAAILLAVPAEGAQQARVPLDPATVAQKAEFVRNLVTDSVSVTRIETSGDAVAAARLTEARSLVGQAQADLKAGDAAGANDRLDQALALVNAEVRRLSGAEVKGAHDRARYERRLKAVNTFLAAYERVAEEGASRAAARQAATIRGLIGKAAAEAAAGDVENAVAILDQAYAAARGDIREMRQGQTLTRSLDFATPAEEYDYELGRNRSHFLLLQFAMTENTPMGSVMGRIEQNRAEAERLRADAERKASAGAHPEAIGLLGESTELLLKSIRMSGIFIPG